MRRLLFGTFFVLLVTSDAHAFDYEPTPISKALAAHDLVMVARIRERQGANVQVERVSVIKGKAPATLVVPGTWRPGTEFSFGPVAFEVGKTYLLMLHRAPGGAYVLSKHFAAPAGNLVSSLRDPL